MKLTTFAATAFSCLVAATPALAVSSLTCADIQGVQLSFWESTYFTVKEGDSVQVTVHSESYSYYNVGLKAEEVSFSQSYHDRETIPIASD